MIFGSVAESVDAPDLKSVERKVRGGSSPPTPITPLNIGGVSDKPMKYRIDTKYAWYDHEGDHLVLLYLIQNIPFTFDELPELARQNPSVIQLANSYRRWTAEDMYRASMYLMMEECHPMMYELELENPELLPVD